ncbi:MAG TPA: LytR C-terminal domain-containing protein [Methylomirabilota bacterium]|nr:LytR C-terminal domain-containing protein [Methylomirabilota bacterium]
MKSKDSKQDSKSIRTFFIYAGIVTFIIILSLAIKTFFVIRASKFDGEHQFTIAIVKQDNVTEFLSIDPSIPSASILQISSGNLSVSSVGNIVGIIPDAKINSSDGLPGGTNITKTIKTMAFNYRSIKTNLTLFDIVRLYLIAKRTSGLNKKITTITISKGMTENNNHLTGFFTDQAITSENISVEVINASNRAGMGTRLAKILTNLGYNIIAVSTASTDQANSTIAYFGQSTYSLRKLQNLLPFSVKMLSKKTIADIIITIGEDSKNSSIF